MSAAPVDLLELAARALGDILGRVMFVGGAVVPLWVTDPGAPPARPTNDVDAVVEILTRSELGYNKLHGNRRLVLGTGSRRGGMV